MDSEFNKAPEAVIKSFIKSKIGREVPVSVTGWRMNNAGAGKGEGKYMADAEFQGEHLSASHPERLEAFRQLFSKVKAVLLLSCCRI